MIEVDIEARLGGFALSTAFTASATGVTALFGRSGAGKSSIVGAIAGLLRPSRGRIAVDGDVLLDTARGIDVPAHRRRVGVVFQDGRLFPHLSVRANLLYGRRENAPPGLEEVVELMDIAPLLDRRPHHLSGGERQRVAIGRALLSNPRLLLMDEPLAALDGARRAEILPFLARLKETARLPILYVSHQMDEIIRLADGMVLIDGGRVVAGGPVEEVTGRLDLRPLTGRYEAGAVLATTVDGHDPNFGLTRLVFDGGTLWVPRLDLDIGAPIRVRVRARDVALALSEPTDQSFLNVIRGRVREAEAADEAQMDVRLAVGRDSMLWARITRRSHAKLDLAPGREVIALVKTVAIDRHSLGNS